MLFNKCFASISAKIVKSFTSSVGIDSSYSYTMRHVSGDVNFTHKSSPAIITLVYVAHFFTFLRKRFFNLFDTVVATIFFMRQLRHGYELSLFVITQITTQKRQNYLLISPFLFQPSAILVHVSTLSYVPVFLVCWLISDKHCRATVKKYYLGFGFNILITSKKNLYVLNDGI